MKTLWNNSVLRSFWQLRERWFSFWPVMFLLAFGLLISSVLQAAEATKTFATPEAAVASLATGAKAQNQEALRSLFGPALAELENPDRVQATNDLRHFAAALDQAQHLEPVSRTKYLLLVGPQRWPFPIPIVQTDQGWCFDTRAGKEELLNRRIGRNELATLEVIRAYVQAQREYASRDRSGEGVLEYAQRLVSSPGKKDGLYWPPELDGELSPLGPLIAQAQDQGYAVKTSQAVMPPVPFQGYCFRILSRQGTHAAGGKYAYVINGHMIAGFALVAWPASYGETGIMTFIVNQQGRVYQKDLGPRTSQLAKKMQAYDPDASWRLSPD